MGWIRRTWSPQAAEEWTREDLLACILSPLAYLALAVGTALSLLQQVVGYVVLALGVFLAWAMYYVIDPKLRMISAEYEAKQHQYMKELEKIQRWEGEA